jgi:DNA-binding transcriptional LysR family regulator
LGVRLLRRTTRKLALTDAGEALYRHAVTILDEVRDAERSVQRRDDVVRGRLRVSVPPGLPPSFGGVVSDLLAKHPELRIDLLASTRHVDLHGEGFDVALRAGSPAGDGLVVRTLHRLQLGAVAAPSYLASHGRPQSVAELARHFCLMGYARGELPQSHWPLLRGGSVHVEGVLHSNDLSVLLESALRGRGVALLPSLVTDPHVATGKLEAVLPRLLGSRNQLMLVYPERELMPASVREFIDAVVAWARAEPCPPRRT